MFYFGITFGSVTMARMSVLIWNVYSITTYPSIYITAIAIVVATALIIYGRVKRPMEIKVKA